MTNVLLTPATPAYKPDLGRKPHRRYRIVRLKFEEIVMAREVHKLSNRQAARAIGLRGAKEFEEAYELLKQFGKDIILNSDWTGVEHVLYACFPHYQRDPQFHALLDEFRDPRPREQTAPVLPVPTQSREPNAVPLPSTSVAAPAAPEPAGEPASPTPEGAGENAPPNPESSGSSRPPIVRSFGSSSKRDPAIVAMEEQERRQKLGQTT